MKIGILGTGMVGQTHAAKLSELGHEVMIGTRDVRNTMTDMKPDSMGNPAFAEWHKKHNNVQLGTFKDAAAHGAVILNMTEGVHAMDALKMAGESNLSGKILIDVSNPLDFSKGRPPTLSVCNTDSLGEQIQRAFPNTMVVKTLNTLSAPLQVNPRQLANGDHHIFMSGNDPEAKKKVKGHLKDWYGWTNIIDLGDITTARGTEMLLPAWLRLWGALKSPMFNFKIVS